MFVPDLRKQNKNWVRIRIVYDSEKEKLFLIKNALIIAPLMMNFHLQFGGNQITIIAFLLNLRWRRFKCDKYLKCVNIGWGSVAWFSLPALIKM